MSMRVTMESRGRALEEEFFRRHERDLLVRLRERKLRERSVADLQASSGIDDEAVLGHLIDASIDTETLMAFTLVPLVAVAWASGSVHDAEREAVLRAADESGVAVGTPAYDALEEMLSVQPGPRLLTVWAEYADSLYASLSEPERRTLAADVVGRARRVAEAAGGFLGLNAISAAEEAVLSEVEAVFRA